MGLLDRPGNQKVLEHEGLGYYGLPLELVPCRVNGPGEHLLGRITFGGDVRITSLLRKLLGTKHTFVEGTAAEGGGLVIDVRPSVAKIASEAEGGWYPRFHGH